MITVVKYGGAAMSDHSTRRAIAKQIAQRWSMGERLVVVHGGGPQISAMLSRFGIVTEFRNGLRVTTREVADIARTVLVEQVGAQIVSDLASEGIQAQGMSGEDGELMLGAVKDPTLGFVGEVASVQPVIIFDALHAGRIPVIASCAPDSAGQILNINADAAASAIAAALGAARLVLVTDVDGIYSRWPDPGSRVATVSAAELEALMPTLNGGMRPKAQACLDAVRSGVFEARIVHGGARGILQEGSDVGTRIRR